MELRQVDRHAARQEADHLPDVLGESVVTQGDKKSRLDSFKILHQVRDRQWLMFGQLETKMPLDVLARRPTDVEYFSAAPLASGGLSGGSLYLFDGELIINAHLGVTEIPSQ